MANLSRSRLTRKCVVSLLLVGSVLALCYASMLAVVGNSMETPQQFFEDAGHPMVPTSGNHTSAVMDPKKLEMLRKLVVHRNARAITRLRILKVEAPTKFRYVIVVQVHDRVTYIKALLESLAATRNIEDTLLVFSHDVIDEEIDSLASGAAASSNLEMVQIYFPFSLQLYPNQFPGAGSQDCPDRVGRPEATKRRCTNHAHPDSYGNYRTPQLAQVKHHWWWKFHFIFSNVPWARDNVPVMFLEEDHYLLPDALVVLDQLVRLRETACTPKCPVMSVAHHKVKLSQETDAYKQYFVGQWIGSRDNIGIVFDYDHFKAINGCAETFCRIDDYNWDWSLYFVKTKCLQKEYPMLTVVAPRVLHIGDCGGIHHKKACSPQNSARTAAATVAKLTDKLFPQILDQSSQALIKPREAAVNGGWGDPRDVDLCQNITHYFAGKAVRSV